MTQKYITLRIKPETHQNLKIVAAFTGESMIKLVERLAREERKKVKTRTNPDANPDKT